MKLWNHLQSLCLTALSYAYINQHEGCAFISSPIRPRTANHSPDDGASTSIPIRARRRHYSPTRVLSLDQSSSSAPATLDESFIEPRTIHEVTIELPLDVILEEMDLSPDAAPSGVAIIGINHNGNAAIYNSNIFSKLKSPDNCNNIISCRNDCICIRDKIMSINGVPCHDKSFDDVITLISNSDSTVGSNKLTIGLGRLTKSIIVNYHNGIAISAKPGESYGFLAAKCGIHTIEYQCRSGNCQTCMRWLEFPDKTIGDDEDELEEEEEATKNSRNGRNIYRRTIMHCVGKVPRGYDWLHVLQ
ncbi:hypothetical protein ACHAXH_004667 [Discostella pseudostelligera]